MAHIATTPDLPLGAVTVHRGVTFVSGIAARLREWNERRRTVLVLSRLSDAQLDDIGLTRGDIDRMAYGARI